MAQVIVTLKVMPESPDVDMTAMETAVAEKVKGFAGDTETKTEIEPIAFGLKALKFIFVMDEALGSTEDLEKAIETIEGVNSVEVTDARRALG